MWGGGGARQWGEEKKVSANQERVQNSQINFEPLSPESAKPQQLSCCDLILFFCPVTPFSFFFSFFPLLTDQHQFPPGEIGLKHTKGPRTILRQKRRTFPELPPPRRGRVLDQLWGLKYKKAQKNTHTQFHQTSWTSLKSDSPVLPEIWELETFTRFNLMAISHWICFKDLDFSELFFVPKSLFSPANPFPLFWQMFEITKTGPDWSAC